MSRIDPSIALQVRPPAAPPDPMENYGKLVGMKNLMTQGRIQEQSLAHGAEQIKGERLKNSVEERAVASDQALTQAIQANTKIGEDGSFGIDHDKVEAMVTRAGYPDAALKYSQARKQIEDQAFDHVKKTMDEAAAKNKKVGATAQSILNADPSLRPAMYSFGLKQLMADGTVDQQTLQQKGIPTQYQGPDTDAMLQQLADAATDNPAKQLADRLEEKRKEAVEKRAADESAAKLPGERAKSLQEQVAAESQLLGAAKTPEDWQRAISQLPADRQKLYPAEYSEDARQRASYLGLDAKTREQMTKYASPTELAYAAQRGDKDAAVTLKALESREIRIDTAKKMAEYNTLFGGGQGGPSGATPAADVGKVNAAALAGMNPQVAAQVKALAEGRMAFPTGFALRSPYWQAMLGAVAKYDPTFDATNYNNRAKLRADFTSGKAAGTVNALNTLGQHLERLDKSIDGLGNFEGVPILNKTANEFKNWLKVQKGDTAQINRFQADVTAVTEEAVRAWRQAGGSEKDIQDWKKTLSTSDSGSGLKASLAELADLVEGKLMAQQNQLEQGMGRAADIRVVTPKTQAVLDKLRGIKAKDYGDPRITEDLMSQARERNKGVGDEILAKAIKDRLDGRK